jgi:hypothetical protein
VRIDLDVMLVERDDSDWIQAQRLLELTPEERIAWGVRAANAMLAIQGVAGHGAA